MFEMRTGSMAAFLVLCAWFWDDILTMSKTESIVVANVDSKTDSLFQESQVVEKISSNLTATEVPTPPKKHHEQYGGGSAFCLILKDDNDILAEWLAYHYHVFNMRRLIVALDPTSLTSPAEIIAPFEKNFGLNVSIWNDIDYAPNWWIERQPLELQSSLNLVDADRYRVCEKVTKIYDPKPGDPYPAETDVEPGNEYVERCNHIFRQRMFYGQCGLQIKKEERMEENKLNSIHWTVFTDTDEYMVPNPWVDHYTHAKDDQSVVKAALKVSDNPAWKIADSYNLHKALVEFYPSEPTAGSMWEFFHKFQKHIMDKRQFCVMMPRIQFGGNEDEIEADATTVAVAASKANNLITTTVWSHHHIDSLRYMYHRNHDYDDWPKGMLDVRALPDDEFELTTERKKGYTEYGTQMFNPQMHYPHNSCDWVDKKGMQVWSVQKGNPYWWRQPMAYHHYVGPLDRFLQKEDQRRDIDLYKQRNDTANYAVGDQNYPKGKRQVWSEENPTERWWIKGWLDSFVATHGSEMVYSVLGSYATQTTTSLNKEL